MANGRRFRGPVCLLGDAVHGLTPWGGYSGQMAVEDAFVLAELLGQDATPACLQPPRAPTRTPFVELYETLAGHSHCFELSSMSKYCMQAFQCRSG